MSEELKKKLFGNVEYNTALEKGMLNDAAINDQWTIPAFFTGLQYRGLLNPFNLKGNIKSLSNIGGKIKEWGFPYLKQVGNPKKAIEKLKEEQQGFVPNADGQGTDFLWGEYIPSQKEGKKGGGYGLAHIEGRRIEDGYNGEEFLNNTLPEIFSNGLKYDKEGHPGRFYLGTENGEAAIRTDYNGQPWQWLDSAYFKYSK